MSSKWQLFPADSTTKYIDPNKNLSFCYVPSHKRKIQISLNSFDLSLLHCKDCEFLKNFNKAEKNLVSSEKNLLSSDWSEFYEEVIEDNNLCPSVGSLSSYKYVGKECSKGINFKPTEEFEVTVEDSIWLKSASTSYAFKPDFRILQSPNIYSTGKICWGRNPKSPKTLLSIYNRFFSMPFNSDLTSHSSGSTKVELVINSFSHSRDSRPKHNNTEFNFYCKSDRPYVGVRLTESSKELAVLPHEVIKTNRKDVQYAVGWAVRSIPDNCYYLAFRYKENSFICRRKSLSGGSKLYPLGWSNEYGHLIENNFRRVVNEDLESLETEEEKASLRDDLSNE